jgi:hypothetical protein
MSDRKSPRQLIFSILALLLIGVAIVGAWKVLPVARPRFVQKLLPQRATRPYGMAPVAWQAYLRACDHAGIHPFRVGQTIGDDPRSVGYHKRDGVLRAGKEKFDYTAAVDLGTQDLSPQKINAFVEALASQGFAAFYRHKGKWKGGEHIHAIYAFLPMKPQLQIQVGEFLRERRRAGKSPKWRAKLRAQETKLKHWMVW